jgi:hypothetical protein
LHGGTVEFALDYAQIFGDSQHANMNVVKAVVVGH